ncbi:MAG: DUF547 domain-containing protein [Gammaproteobacteria bacterium]|nr:DUF547 domain-containing protein [Gammaproteobacteria bacterium]
MKKLAFILLLSMVTLSSHAASFDHAEWDQLLKKHVISINQGVATQVDYRGFSRDRFQLKSYLGSLESISRATFKHWPKQQQLAFLINAYNAWTVELILTEYPELESIKDLGSWIKSPWDRRFIPLLGSTHSLDEIEHGMIRAKGAYQEPRIHFAVNCASIGCPALSMDAFTGDKLEAQLEVVTHLFLSDRSRNFLKNDTLNISKIFKWYRDDFESGWGGYHTLQQFLSAYQTSLGLSDDQVQRINSSDIEIEFLDYDWKLNDKR